MQQRVVHGGRAYIYIYTYMYGFGSVVPLRVNFLDSRFGETFSGRAEDLISFRAGVESRAFFHKTNLAQVGQDISLTSEELGKNRGIPSCSVASLPLFDWRASAKNGHWTTGDVSPFRLSMSHFRWFGPRLLAFGPYFHSLKGTEPHLSLGANVHLDRSQLNKPAAYSRAP